MTGQAGLNGPADARLAPNFYALLGARWVRVVLKSDVDLTPWINECHARGLKVLGVIARESIDPALTYEEAAHFYAEKYPLGETIMLNALQVGNEPDHVSESSWTMDTWDLNELLAAFNQAFPESMLIGPGLVSGDPTYLNGVDLDLLDAIAVHPYGQRPDTLQDWSETPGNFGTVAGLLDSYRVHGKPIWVTEVGVSTEQVSEEFQAQYCEAMMKSLMLRADVPVAFWFCADDAMVNGFGIFDSDGLPKKSAPAYMRAAGPAVKPEQPTEEPPIMDPNVHAIDVASYQPRDLGALIRAYQAKHVVVHLYMPNEGPGPQYSRDQINSTRDNGASAGGYVFPYRPSDSVDFYFQNTLELCASVSLELPICWVDCEYTNANWPGPDESWLDRWFALCDSVQMPSGLYCNPDWLNTHPWMAKYGPQRPLWLAKWDGVADVTHGAVPSPWTQLAGKQWEVSSGPLGEIDRDVFRPEYTVYAGSQPPPVDPCENLRRQLVEWSTAVPYKAPSKKKLTALLGG